MNKMLKYSQLLLSVWRYIYFKKLSFNRVLIALRKWFPPLIPTRTFQQYECVEMRAEAWVLCLSDIANYYIIKHFVSSGVKMTHNF